MCMAAAGFLASALGSVASYAAQKQQTDAYNAQAAANAQNASIAAGYKYASENRKFTQDMRELQNKGYEETIKARKAKGEMVASAGASGIDVSSLTFGDIVSDNEQKLGRTIANIDYRQTERHADYVLKTKAYEQEARGRIQSMLPKADPSPLGMIVGIASAGVKAYKAYA